MVVNQQSRIKEGGLVKGSETMTGVSQLLAFLLTLYFLLGESILGSWLYQRFLKEVGANPVARRQFYVLWSGVEWLWVS